MGRFTGGLSMMFRSFWRSDRGALSVIIVLALPLVLSIIGAALDFSRAYSARAALQRAAEAAALAAASLRNAREPDAVVAEYVSVNLGALPPDLTFDVSQNSSGDAFDRRVEVTVNGEIPAYFLTLVGIDAIDFTVSGVAEEAVMETEIALVLDVSTSMQGSKLSAMQRAAREFVEEILDRGAVGEITISVIPFAGTVNVGQTIFDRFVWPDGSADIDPTMADYDIGEDVLTSRFKFTGADTCLETPLGAMQSDAAPPTGELAQVPDFGASTTGPRWCPPTEALFNESSLSVLRGRINAMAVADGTAPDIGALWGYRALSPSWRGVTGGGDATRPGDYGGDRVKIMILMTDGVPTSQARPRDPATGSLADFQELVETGDASSGPTSGTVVGNLRRVCQNAQADGVIIYSIGFQINSGTLPDLLLSECASGPGRYYFVEDLDISSAFEAIASSISALRVSG